MKSIRTKKTHNTPKQMQIQSEQSCQAEDKKAFAIGKFKQTTFMSLFPRFPS